MPAKMPTKMPNKTKPAIGRMSFPNVRFLPDKSLKTGKAS